MSGNLENDRSVTASKMYPIDLAQKITIVKSVSNTEVKMAHLIPGQPKTTGAGQIITHAGPVSMMRPAAILSPSVSSQPQMIVSGSPLLQGTQIVSQSSQIIGPNSQIISQSQIIGPSGQILSPGTQIISQGTQLSAQVSNSNTGCNSNNVQVTVPSSVSGQVLSVGGLVSSAQGLVSGAGNLVVSSSVRTLPPSVRVLPPLTHHINRPAVHVNVNVSSGAGVLVSKGVTSHVPRGLAAGASLAVRPVTPNINASASSTGPWSSGRGRGALVYGARAPLPRAAPPRAPSAPPAAPATPAQPLTSMTPATAAAVSTQPSHAAIVTLPATTVLTSSGIISGSLRAVTPTPRAVTPTPAPAVAPRPLPLLQRNYQPAKVVGVASVGVRGVVGNSAPAQLYYEVPRAAHPQHTLHTQPHTPQGIQHTQPHTPQAIQHTQPHTPQGIQHTQPHTQQGIQHTQQHSQQGIQHTQTHTQQGIQHTQPHTPQGIQHTQQHSQQGIQHTQPHTQQGIQHTLPHSQQSIQHTPQHVPQSLGALPRPLTPYHSQSVQVSVVSAVQPMTGAEARAPVPASAGAGAAPVLPRPTILRKRENDGSPIKSSSLGPGYGRGGTGWEDVPGGGGGGGGSGGSTTISASSSPAPDDEPDPPRIEDVSPRKKPRKQMLTNEVRQCQEYQAEEAPPTPPPVAPPKRPQLSSTYVCGWRSTALHFTRPADVRRREPRNKDILAIASQKHALTSADGWKVHHLTAQMDDLVLLEQDVGNQLSSILKTVEGASGRALQALQPHTHNLLELIKGNIQRSKIVCEGIQESREDILRVFTHRNFVSDILTRQADKRCFRKHRSQS